MTDLTKFVLVPMNSSIYKSRICHNVTSFPTIDYSKKEKPAIYDDYPAFFIELSRTRNIFNYASDRRLDAEVVASISLCKIKDYGNGYVSPIRYERPEFKPRSYGRMKKRLVNKLLAVGRDHFSGTEKCVRYAAKGGIYEFDGSLIDYVGIFTSLQEFYKALRDVYQDL